MTNEQQTSQEDPDTAIQDNEGAAEAIESIIGLSEDLKTPVEEQDWVTALEIADNLQEQINALHTYIAEQVE